MHTPKHSIETPYTCPVCAKGFKWKHGLNSHLIVHSNEKKLLCDECGYSTSHLKTLRAHQLSHTGFLFRCTTSGCSYTSRRKENLKIHMATHKNETPFVCEVCGHRFSQNKNLKVNSYTWTNMKICKFKAYLFYLNFFSDMPLSMRLRIYINVHIVCSPVIVLIKSKIISIVSTRKNHCNWNYLKIFKVLYWKTLMCHR